MTSNQHHLAFVALGISSIFYFITFILSANLVANTIPRKDYEFNGGYLIRRGYILDPAGALIAFCLIGLGLNFGQFFAIYKRIRAISQRKAITKNELLISTALIALSGVCSVIVLGISGQLTDVLQGQRYYPDPDSFRMEDMPSYLKAPGGMGIVSALLNLLAIGTVTWIMITTKKIADSDNVEGGRDDIKDKNILQPQTQTQMMPIITSSPQIAVPMQHVQPISQQQPIQATPLQTPQNTHSWSVYRG